MNVRVRDLDADQRAALLEVLEDLMALPEVDDDDLQDVDDDAARMADGAAHVSTGLALFSGMKEARQLRKAVENSVTAARRRAGATRNHRDAIRRIHTLAETMRERVEAGDDAEGGGE